MAILLRPLRQQFPLLILGLLLAFGGVACGESATPAPAGAGGFEVLPRFEKFYQSFGGSDILGEPITSACEAPDGRIVQYFQRVRLDSPSEQAEMMIYPLGEWALSGVRTPVPAPVPENSAERLFPETGYAVQDEFLAFYEANSGETILGPPLSPQLDEGELRVQYFRNGRLEWHPDAPQSRRVRLGPLGHAHYLQEGSGAMQCDVLARPATVSENSALAVEASVKAPILYTGEEQVVYVEIATPIGQPVSEVPVSLSVHYRGDSFELALGETDDAGTVTGPLPLPTFVPGEEVEVEIRIHGTGNRVLGESTLSFKTWW